MTSLRTLESWSSTLASFGPAPKVVDDEEDEDDEDLTAGAERMVLVVEGPKRVGKSTFAKLLLNRLLTRFVFSYWLPVVLTLNPYFSKDTSEWHIWIPISASPSLRLLAWSR